MIVNLGAVGVLTLLEFSLNLPLVTTPTRNPLCSRFPPQPISFTASSAQTVVIQGSHFILRSLPGHLSHCLVVWPIFIQSLLMLAGRRLGCGSLVMTQTPDSVQGRGCILIQCRLSRVSHPQDGALCHRLISPNTERFQAPDWNSQLPTMEAASVPLTAAITWHAA